ncbi:MAG: YggT family protein [Candidatus Margulisbacteria bacterium]|nr:YggT family protein [Candidatus Margulisiibacteriota bacterium]MBU1021316.1 YggT family protein [Candidatus Margulisiibacteriota bacterium]MBU1729195.1 YggT family protein [Candidatus Margulisiibacteriota bacterium]MBU1954868.1 YggT family protein [Candidatus Margulisiibacteriota bacterium]
MLILAQVFLPWIPGARYNPVVQLIQRLTDPLLNLIRKGLPPNRLGIDASPAIAIILLWVLQRIILRLIG